MHSKATSSILSAYNHEGAKSLFRREKKLRSTTEQRSDLVFHRADAE